MSKLAAIALREAAADLERRAKKLREKANLIELVNREPVWDAKKAKPAKKAAAKAKADEPESLPLPFPKRTAKRIAKKAAKKTVRKVARKAAKKTPARRPRPAKVSKKAKAAPKSGRARSQA